MLFFGVLFSDSVGVSVRENFCLIVNGYTSTLTSIVSFALNSFWYLYFDM